MSTFPAPNYFPATINSVPNSRSPQTSPSQIPSPFFSQPLIWPIPAPYFRSLIPSQPYSLDALFTCRLIPPLPIAPPPYFPTPMYYFPRHLIFPGRLISPATLIPHTNIYSYLVNAKMFFLKITDLSFLSL